MSSSRDRRGKVSRQAGSAGSRRPDQQETTREVHADFEAAISSEGGGGEETAARSTRDAARTTQASTTTTTNTPTSRLSLASRSLLNELQNLSSYPAASTALAPAQPISGGGGTAPASLQRTVESALQSVLGRLPKAGDQKSFMAALKVSFTYKETTTGRGQYEWTPRSYIGQTDLGGGVTGAQASLVTFARTALDNSLPLLDGLFPLVSVDDEDVEAATSILRMTWTQFVEELSREGGPRIARANELIDSILDDTRTSIMGGTRGGHLTRLGVLLGIIDTDDNDNPRISQRTNRAIVTRRNVITPEEEANLTNYIALRDFITAVNSSWETYAQNSRGRDLGTGLVILSRLLSVISESVNEVYAAMDSVLIGDAERVATRIDLGDRDDISMDELLSWISTFASEEAPLLVQDGGRWGVEAILPTAALLQELTAAVARLIDAEAQKATQTFSKGMVHPRVKNALGDLLRYLTDMRQMTEEILRADVDMA
jgi:hypothetical protein